MSEESKVIINPSYLSNIAEAIRTKLGVTTSYKLSAMPAAINTISNPDIPAAFITRSTFPATYTNSAASFVRGFRGISTLTSVSFAEAKTIDNYAFFSCTSLVSINLPKCETVNNCAFGRYTVTTSTSTSVDTKLGVNALNNKYSASANNTGSAVSYTYTNNTGHDGTFLLACTRTYTSGYPSMTCTTNGSWLYSRTNYGGLFIAELASGKKMSVTADSKAHFQVHEIGTNLTGLTCTNVSLSYSRGTTVSANAVVTNGEKDALYVAYTACCCYFNTLSEVASGNVPAITVTNCNKSQVGLLQNASGTMLNNGHWNMITATCTPNAATNKIQASMKYTDGGPSDDWGAAQVFKFTKTITTTYDLPGLSKISDVSLPKCKVIGTSAFNGCTGISTLSLPSCTTISNSAFYGCSALKSLYLAGSSVPALANSSVFLKTPLMDSTITGTFGKIYVPASLSATYKTAANWSYMSARINSI